MLSVLSDTAYYDLSLAQICERIRGIPYKTANLANIAAILWQNMPGINWVGFYLMENGGLVLGPFQGKPARVEIPVGQGVCGTAVAQDRPQIVADVHCFPGHIACDCMSQSELVIPIHQNGAVAAVLDIDSPSPNRFTQADVQGLLPIIAILEEQVF